MAAKLWRAEKVDEARLAFFGRHAWTLALPFLLFAALGWAIPEDGRFLALYFAIQLAIYALPIVLLTSIAVAYLGATKRQGAVDVELDEKGLTVGRTVVPRRELATAWAIGGDVLEVITHGGDELRLTFQDPAELASLAERVRAAADRSRSYALTNGGSERRLIRKAFAAYGPLAFAAVIVGAAPEAFWLLPLGAATSWLLGRGTRRARFGADGVSIEGRFRTRYVPYRDVTQVTVVRRAFTYSVHVTLSDGRRVNVLDGMSQVRARLVGALIEEGTAMVGRGEDAGAELPALGRGGASEDELLRRLLGVAQGGRYRDAAMEPERLGHLIRNPAAPPAHRIAAAIALREAPGGRAQIRVAAGVTAEPEVRIAFETLAEEQLDERRSRDLLRRVSG